MDLKPPAIPEEIAKLAEATDYVASSKHLPAVAGQKQRDGLRKAILEHLAATHLAGLSTIGAGGWPVSHCMHFAATAGPDTGPVLYLFTNEGTRKLANLDADRRVSVVALQAPAAQAESAQPVLRLQGLASIVRESAEHELAMQCQFEKPGYDFARYLGLETQIALRVDVVAAVWHDVASGQPPVTVNFPLVS